LAIPAAQMNETARSIGKGKNRMNEEKQLCPHNFKTWLAFLLGMVLILIAVVVFDKVLRDGRFGLYDGRREDEPLGRPIITQSVGMNDALVQTAGFLSSSNSESTSGSWLGIEASNLTKETASALGYELTGGVIVSKIVQGSPAEETGLKLGDILTGFNYQEVDTVDTLSRLLSKLDPDTRVKIVFFRDGNRETSYIRLGQTSQTQSQIESQTPAPGGDRRWGIVVSELTENLRKTYDIPDREEGVVVLMVVPGSASDRAGVNKGDLIEQVDRNRISGLTDFFESLQIPADQVLMKIFRNNSVLFLRVTSVSPLVPVYGPTSTEITDLDVKETNRPLATPSPNRPNLILPSQETQIDTSQKYAGTKQSLLGIPTEIIPDAIVKIVSGLIDGDQEEEIGPIRKKVKNLEITL
jgi:membrane-associated protease RseP (regulator of RpoE activity)